MAHDTAALESQLNDFDPERRSAALEALCALAAEGEIVLPDPGIVHNLHSHTFFSYNGYGYSPTAFAWLARKAGLGYGGIVDFDVLDGVDEFHGACAAVGIKGTAGIETRIFIPEFAEKVINSPGEPGVAYHMGVGFVSADQADPAMLDRLKSMAQDRNTSIIERVNPYLAPVAVDYERDLLPLAPKGNPTERHLCAAYAAKAEAVFPDAAARAAFWAEKLGADAAKAAALLASPPDLQAAIRAKTMKQGGPGYVAPDLDTFPRLLEFNAFVLSAGAIPCCAWLDGTTAGEQEMDRLLDIEMDAGVAMINIIPDRNWNIADPAAKAKKTAAFDQVVALANARHLPIVVGTEMNAYGQPFVDDFQAPEMARHTHTFLRGARIAYAHTVLQRSAGMGYLSRWASRTFHDTAAKNDFFALLGERLPMGALTLAIHDVMGADEVLACAETARQ